MQPAPKVYYFGVYPGNEGRGIGHALYGPRGTHVNQYDLPPALSLGRLDGGYAPGPFEVRPPQKEGVARTTVVNGYTVLSFWDRTGDARPNSHSTFVVQGRHHMRAALTEAIKAFPEVFERIRTSARPFTVVPLC